VLFLVALDGAAAPMVGFTADRERFTGLGTLLLLFPLLLSAAAALSVGAMFLHARLVLWTGRLLGGAGRPVELHAATGWSLLPRVLTSAPLLLELPLRLAAADAEPVPGGLQAALDLAVVASGPLRHAWLIATTVSALLWLGYLAEAQRFAWWRALVNELLAAAALALPALGVLWGVITAAPKLDVLAQVLVALAVLAVLFAVGLFIESAWARRAGPG
jgi:hypothetical protein